MTIIYWSAGIPVAMAAVWATCVLAAPVVAPLVALGVMALALGMLQRRARQLQAPDALFARLDRNGSMVPDPMRD